MSCASRRHNPERGVIRVRTLSETLPPPQTQLPQFKIAVPPPDLSRWTAGNCGIAGVHHFEATLPGPHVALTALMHGNEYSGAHVLADLLTRNIRPHRGRLSLIFLNLAAFARFDPQKPTLSRFVEEDMNRLWCADLVHSSHTSVEMERVREIIPIMETVDALLDLHSMLWPSPPAYLCGLTEKSHALACALSAAHPKPPLVVQDGGHEDGPRLIDYERFASNRTGATACLLEAGQHWRPESVTTAHIATQLFLEQMGLLSPHPLCATPAGPARCAVVTHTVLAHSSRFVFTRAFRSGDVVKKAGSLVAFDGQDEIRTPYSNCLLVLPNLRPMRGHTAVRLARLVDSA
ncbi:succinylglutamate desuccinylase/aspartoacylase family protein [Acetobacter sp.]|uniref:succinylglutamate desuccinylase/aspartoacylase domain-containing protein n=1 Tax=Acetobacter sp. TaxID=440 RepID=UPI00258FC16B|nr:succinylglutamate desuccinylase/aspartoacylase family protein [Acetobacter sp.]MCC6105820.1 succinylglutamate desuccinylase/aspartoacylase family protein [Acetobacter sp.]